MASETWSRRGSNIAGITYDAAGNETTGPSAVDPSKLLHMVYDAWNRLTAIYNDDGSGGVGTQLAGYSYDARNWRIQRNSFDNTGTLSHTFDSYYNENWQELETRQDGSSNPLDQYIWDPRYIDSPVVRFHDGNTDGDYTDAVDNTLYYTTDANNNVTALVDGDTSSVVERYSYNSYGQATVYDGSWTVQAGSQYDNSRTYGGYVYDADSGFDLARNRYYSPVLGQWISRDPIGEQGSGSNLYALLNCDPVNETDPTGQSGSGVGNGGRRAGPVAPPMPKAKQMEGRDLGVLKRQLAEWATEGYLFSIALLNTFLSKITPAENAFNSFANLIKSNADYRDHAQSYFGNYIANHYLWAAGYFAIPDFVVHPGQAAFDVGFYGFWGYPEGDLRYALGGAHLGYTRAIIEIIGQPFTRCWAWKVTAKMQQLDDYTFLPTGFANLRTNLSESYLAANDLQLYCGYTHFLHREEWDDVFEMHYGGA